ncbi:MAG TPA: DEAD/DEAH box helicase family protein, partial [Gemmataceae bacterium]|nr:DEAD/DEAH box helicase family protein [Gemmataceae bacterium]
EAPTRYFKFDDDGITDEIVEGRRPSSYFIPIATPRKKGKQASLESQWTQDRARENDDINFIRSRVALWRDRGRTEITPVSRNLLEYWTRPDREKKLFFCQIDALETLIYLTEGAEKFGDASILNKLQEACAAAGTTLFRLACKAATGSGKTTVMAMLVAWHTLNRRAYPNNGRFADAFLIVTPGITVRDRLRVLLPSDPGNYYQALDLVPPDDLAELGTAKIVVTNYHAFKAREGDDAARLTKAILARGKNGAFTETPAQVVRRVCRELGAKRNIVVLNDEAHHCYRSKPAEEGEKLTGDEKKEAQDREEAARLWITGLEAVKEKIGVKVVYDLSATPFYLRGSGYAEGTLFPWVVSDFSLIDAIESGIVKVPRVPVADDAMTGDFPTFRDLWYRIRDALPRKGRGTEAVSGPPQLPAQLEAALQSLYAHYRKQYEAWEKDAESRADGRTPPVFIVVCNNTNVSKLVFDYLAGYETDAAHPDGSPVVAAGKLPIFSNEDHGRWVGRPNTILVDSQQLESDEGMSADFKKLAHAQIDEFKTEIRRRFPGRDADAITDQDLMREVLNTVGKAGKLGENVRCIVSVSMLTEGWDANTVTHILGVRAFGTQLLCEQVVGRGLRRMSHALNEDGRFEPEYAEVYGVPFSFMPCAGSGAEKKQPPRPKPGRVRALAERLAQRPYLEITFPRVAGYRYEMPPTRLDAHFTEESNVVLSAADIPTEVENAPIVGETVFLTLDDVKQRREQEIAFAIAKVVLEKYFRAEDAEPASEAQPPRKGVQVWLFPQVLAIVRRWMAECVVCKDHTFPQLLLFVQKANEAAEKIHRAIAAAASTDRRLRAVLQPYDTLGTTAHVSFDTTKPTWRTAADKCHVSHVPCDSGWEAKFAQTLEGMPEVKAYVKNQNLWFKIPYTYEGRPGNYYPDYIVRIDDGRGLDDLLNVVVEISGRELGEKEAKAETARTMWVPAVNNEGAFGRWAFLEIRDPWDAEHVIRNWLMSRAKQYNAAEAHSKEE